MPQSRPAVAALAESRRSISTRSDAKRRSGGERRASPWAAGRLAVAVLVGVLAGAPAQLRAATSGGCVDDVTALLKPNQVPNNCTANDVTFVSLGLGTQTDGCLKPSDTAAGFLRARVRNTTAQSRYDVGLYFAVDGDPNVDGALTGSCLREIFSPPGAQGATTCGPLDLDGGSGPFLNLDGDSCGDLLSSGTLAPGCDEDMDGFWDDSSIDLTDPIVLPCTDADVTGFVDVPTCTTWGNNADEVGTAAVGSTAACDSEVEAIPGTRAKCRCEVLDSTIPAPNLSASCSCAATMVTAGSSTTCTVNYTNNVTCTPDLSTPERLRCGTAGFLRFEVDYDETRGSVSALSTSATGSEVDEGDRITWIPTNQISGGTPGVIGPNGQTETLSFSYSVAPSARGTATFTAHTYWSETSPTDLDAVEQAALSCGTDVTILAPEISATESDSLEVDVDGDGVVDVGDTVRYTVVARNDGNLAASGVSFAAPAVVNAPLVVGSVTSSLGSVTSGNTAGDTSVGVDVGTLALAGGTVTITFDVTVDDPLPDGVREITAQGTISSNEAAEVLTDDPDTPAPGDPTVTPVQLPSDTVFADDFEGGDTSAWSATIGLP